jgi:hypothetical protein
MATFCVFLTQAFGNRALYINKRMQLVNFAQKFHRIPRFWRSSHVIRYACGALALTSCTTINDTSVPAATDQRRNNFGSLFNAKSLLFKKDGKRTETLVIQKDSKINKFLWQAALDTLSFMPIRFASPAKGILSTDWFTNPNVPNTRVRVSVQIFGKDLRADAVKVSVKKQKLILNAWTDRPFSKEDRTALEIMIVDRARKLLKSRTTSS